MQIRQHLNRWVAGGLAASLCLGIMATMTRAQDGEDGAKPKHTIKEVMKHQKGKDSLFAKVVSGEASDDQKKELLDLYISMLEAKPPKGEMDSWQKLAGASALAAAKVVVGREGAVDELKKSGGACAACHKAHKP